MKLRTLVAVGGLGLALVVLAGQVKHLLDDPTVLKPVDYLEYWSAGRATLRGDNPYDGRVLYPLQQECGTTYDDPIMMWNPPWTLPLAMAVGAVPWRLGQLAWFVANLAAVVAAALLLWQTYGGPRRLAWLPVIVALVFAPVPFLLLLGQISGFLLFGLAGFLAAFRARRYGLAGAAAALTAIKPHLLILFALALALESLRDLRARRAVMCGALCLAAAGLLPLWWNPDVWSQYRAATGASGASGHNTLNEWRHPTIGYALRMALPGEPFNAQFVPAVLVVLSFPFYWYSRRQTWSWPVELPRLTLISLLAAPYGAWAFDLVLLLVPVVQATAWLAAADLNRRTGTIIAVGYLVLNALVVLTVMAPESQANPWIAPGTLLGYLLVGRLTRVASSPEPHPALAPAGA
jgi:hypothetical protein